MRKRVWLVVSLMRKEGHRLPTVCHTEVTARRWIFRPRFSVDDFEEAKPGHVIVNVIEL